MKKLLYIVLISLVSAFRGWSQNGHFTQYYNSGIHTNPAESGAENNIRAICNYRKQWTAIASGYTTESFSLDAAGKYFSYGIIFSSDKAGPGSLKQSNALISLAKHFRLNTFNVLSFGIQAGVTQYSLNPSLLKFGNQYNNDTGFDPTLSNGENFNATSYLEVGNSFGASWKNTAGKWKPTLSVSAKNLIKQQHSLLSLNQEASSPLYSLRFEVGKKLTTKIELIPGIYYQQQKKASELLVGCRVGYYISESQKIYGGLGVRNKDAMLTYIGIPLKNIMLGFSYDINTSFLKPATSGKGAWEISLVAGFKRKRKRTAPEDLIETKKITSDGSQTPSDEILKVSEPSENQTISMLPKQDTSIVISNNPSQLLNTISENMIPEQNIKTNTIDNRKAVIPNADNSIVEVKKIKYLIYFDSDKSVIKPEYQLLLNTLVTELKNSNSYHIIINGHTDMEGASAYNIELGEARANQVMTFLVEQGINIDTIKTCTYGKSNPLIEGSDDKTNAQNRRVEIIVLKK